MVEGNKKTQKNKPQSEVFTPRTVLVCGVDIEGSTALKVQNPGTGKFQVANFLKSFNAFLRNIDARDGDNEKDGWFLWRVRGDELIYFRIIPFAESDECYNQYIEKYFKEFVEALEGLSSRESMGVHGYAFLLHSKDDPWDFSWNLIAKNGVDKTEQQIDLENGMGDPNDLDLLAEEVFSEYGGNIRNIQNDYHIDFIGRDVDLGFRIAEHSRPHYFVLSPGLAKCISVTSRYDRDNEIIFLGFHELKGCSIGHGGPEKFPIYFLPIKNKGESLDGEILDNYRAFNAGNPEDMLREFEEYERASCKRASDKSDEKKIDANDKSGVNPNILQEAQRLLEQVRESLERYQEERLHHLQETSFPPSEEETTY